MSQNNEKMRPFGGAATNIEDRESLVKQASIKDEVNL